MHGTADRKQPVESRVPIDVDGTVDAQRRSEHRSSADGEGRAHLRRAHDIRGGAYEEAFGHRSRFAHGKLLLEDAVSTDREGVVKFSSTDSG